MAFTSRLSLVLTSLALGTTTAPAFSQDGDGLFNLSGPSSGRLLLTGGVSQVEGSAGGGLTPWALIAGYGTENQIGGAGYFTRVETDDYSLESYGVQVGIFNRVELSISQQSFNLEDVGVALGLGPEYDIDVTTYGAKVRLFGDAVLEQDSWIPQVSVGIQYKDNAQDALVQSLGADDGDGLDVYLSATKLYLDQSLLLNATVRMTQANQFGILGFDEDYSVEFEASAAYLINRFLAVGAEYRTKPDNLAIAAEGDAFDVFVAWAPTKNVSATLAYVDLGNIVVGDQTGVYASLNFSF
ncbi:DUF3034 family protein [uncultured Maricaulis sp.]|uniref:DUF3034 family protein n=1 Tax=uncultured Maricaulis sp. TaxID=174710 RepID=UPI00260C2AFD|nr:DUF3034 family protein [uncultured Maricaulis sp.]